MNETAPGEIATENDQIRSRADKLRRLTEAGNTDAAIAILEMNGEFYPKSSSIDFTLAELHRGHGEKDLAVRRYRATLEKDPDHQGAKRWLSELTKP